MPIFNHPPRLPRQHSQRGGRLRTTAQRLADFLLPPPFHSKKARLPPALRFKTDSAPSESAPRRGRIPATSALMNSFSLSCGTLPSSSSSASCGSSHTVRIPVSATSQPSKGGKEMAVDNTSFQKKTLDRINPLFTTTTQSCTPFASPISAVTTELQSSPLEKLRNGYLKFKENYMKDQTLVKTLAEGQQPPYMIIACCDSRVDPCTVLNLGPGEAFVLRNIGNMVPPYSSEKACSSAASAMEFAVLFLKVKHLVVIGHSQCGAVRALMGMEDDGSNAFSEFIEDWVLISKGASKKVKDMHRSSPFEEQCTSCEKEVINTSLLNCLSYPFVRQRMASGELTLHGGYYDFINNQFESWDVDLSCTSSLDKFQ